MAHDLELAERVREMLGEIPDVTERKMFGGLAFMVRRHMTVVVSGHGGLMVRADPQTSAGLVETTAAEFAVMRGREMPGWLRLSAESVDTESELRTWVDGAVAYSSTLPAKRA